MADHTLSDLAQQAEQLSSHMDEGADELPKVGRSLNQILQNVQSLCSPASATTTGAHDAQASILLGSRGLDLLHMNDKLQSLSETRALEPLEAGPDTDIQTFLRNERHNAIISANEDACRQTCIQVQNFFWEQKKADWEQRKQKFMAAFSNVNASNLVNITSQPQESLIGSLSYTSQSTNLSVEETMYAKLICNHNIEVLNGGVKPTLAIELSKEAASMDVQGVVDLWNLVKNITDIPIKLGSDVGLSRTTVKVQGAIVKQAKKHLESCYEKHMKSLVFSELKRAQLGGVPGLIHLVKAYLGVVLSPQSTTHLEDGTSRGVAVWALIFYCLRAGGIRAVCSAVEDNNSPAVAEVISALQQIEKSDTGRLPADTEKKIRLSYKRNVKAITDPFKKAVYCLLGHCDPEEDHPEIIVTTDDYLWLKLSMVDLDATHTKGKHDVLSLPQLQNKLYQQYGEKHFNAWQQPFLYASVLLLTAQFEAAIEFLSRIEKLRCHAVHIALCLFESNLLALPSQHNAPLLSSEVGDPEGLLRLNLVQLIRIYIRKFEANNLQEAIHYCYFLRNLRGTGSQSVFGECVSNLVTDTREYDLLLGSMNPDGSRNTGIVDKFKVDMCEIAESVAKDSEIKGLHEDAIKLYDLSLNHDSALRLLNQLFSQIAHQRSDASGGSKRDRIVELATSIAKRFRTHGHNASALSVSTLHLLLDLSTFFNVFHQDKFSDSIEIVRKLQIIPFNKDEVQSRVSNITSLGPEVKSLISQVLLAAMTATFNIYQKTCSGSKDQSFSTSILSISTNLPPASKHLKEQARAIVAYAGMIPIRLNADVNARLVQLEALIN